MKDGEEDCKPFEVEIDRSPDTAQGIIDAINEAIYQLRLADEASAITEFDTDDFNTTFSYKLLNERSRKAEILLLQHLTSLLSCLILKVLRLIVI